MNRLAKIAFVLATMMIAAPLVGEARAATLPPFNDVEKAVDAYFAKEKSHQPGDLITRKQAAAILDEVERIGWKLADRAKFEKLSIDDRAFLAEQLRSTGGKKFMRQVSSLELVYDRLDRLSQMPQGRSTIERLIKGPDGYKLLDYMTNAKGGQELAKMLSKDGAGNFDQPTGKFYTADQLLKQLESKYAAAVAAEKKTPRR